MLFGFNASGATQCARRFARHTTSLLSVVIWSDSTSCSVSTSRTLPAQQSLLRRTCPPARSKPYATATPRTATNQSDQEFRYIHEGTDPIPAVSICTPCASAPWAAGDAARTVPSSAICPINSVQSCQSDDISAFKRARAEPKSAFTCGRTSVPPTTHTDTNLMLCFTLCKPLIHAHSRIGASANKPRSQC